MPKSPMEMLLQTGINGSARGYFFCPYNEPHPVGIQRKTQREGYCGLGIADCGIADVGCEMWDCGFRIGDWGISEIEVSGVRFQVSGKETEH